MVVGGRPFSEDPAARWLVWLRWVALLGMAATIAVAESIVGGLRLAQLALTLGCIATTNLVWWILIRRSPGEPIAPAVGGTASSRDVGSSLSWWPTWSG